MHTSFFSELNLGFFRGMVKVSRQLGDIVAAQTIAAEQQLLVDMARAHWHRKFPAKSQKAILLPTTFFLHQPRPLASRDQKHFEQLK